MKMNEINILKHKLHKFKIALKDWEVNGYDTPELTYHEQLDLYKERIEFIENRIEELKK